MKRYWAYLRYVLRHKWFVFLECWKRGLYWRGFVHDLSKLRPGEFFPYAKHFYAPGGYQAWRVGPDPTFDYAWNQHVCRNTHHWEHYVLVDEGPASRRADRPAANITILPMMRDDVVEMLCDWIAMGRVAGTHVLDWWDGNQRRVILHDSTRDFLTYLLVEVQNERQKSMFAQPKYL